MAISVRRADLDLDEALIIDFLARNHTPDSNKKRFDWLYRRSPAGQARVWIAYDSGTLVTVGVAAAFPRRIYLHSRQECAWVLGDFCIDRGHRSLGPAMQLQRACLRDLESGHESIYYDFPSVTMTAVYQRLGIAPQHRMVRLVKLLRAEGQIQKFIKPPQLARTLSSIVNVGLDASQTRFRRPLQKGLSVAFQEGACGDEFTQLAELIGSSLGVCLQRSGEYLNWRYREHPYRSYEIIAMRRAAMLLGCAIVGQEGSHLNLVELFGEFDVIPELMRAVISIAVDRKLQTVTTAALESHRWIELFRDLGFWRRDEVPVIAGSPKPGADGPDLNGTVWCLMNGDRES